MLTPIQSMEYYLRTGFGESTTYSGGKEDPKQGSCQGNTVALPTWQHLSSLLINGQKHAGHGIIIVAPISKKSHSQVGILFVDGTHMWEGLGEDNDVAFTLEKGQQGVNSWRSNLLAMKGELRPDKCSYTVHRIKPTKTATGSTSKKSQQRLQRRQTRTKKNWTTSGRT